MPPRLPAALLAALLVFAAALSIAAGPAGAAPFLDAAGRRVILPDTISRILPAERNAEVLIYVLAPDKLAGMEAGPGRAVGGARGLRPAVLRWRPRSTPDSMAATARQVGADLIIDAGTVTPDRAAFADAVQALSGIPYILIDSSFVRMPRVLRQTGAILHVRPRAEELRTWAEHAVAGLRGRLLIQPAETRPRVYYGLGPDGLTTPLPGAPAGGALDEAGAINVAAPLGRATEVRISREQLFLWDPQIIIAERRSFYNALKRDRGWRQLSAVRNGKVYLEPTMPFGWIEDPSGVNRLIGLYWLSTLFYADATQEDLRSTVCDFYEKFYRMRLTNGQLEAMVRPAGAPPAESARVMAEPLVGLGAAPTSTLPPGSPGTPSVPVTPIPALPQASPTALCTIPGAAAPIPGMYTAPSDAAPPELPGAAPPGRAGRAPAAPGLPAR
jgi:iron complex transport system substrate-binding protein